MKALNKIKSLFKRPKLIHPDFSYPVGMVEVEPEAVHLHTALGISQERADHLMDYSHGLAKKYSCVHQVMIDVSCECKHPNELAFIVYHLAQCPVFNPPVFSFLRR